MHTRQGALKSGWGQRAELSATVVERAGIRRTVPVPELLFVINIGLKEGFVQRIN
jgi:hypothetical protein